MENEEDCWWEVFELNEMAARKYGKGWVYGIPGTSSFYLRWVRQTGNQLGYYEAYKTRAAAERAMVRQKRPLFWTEVWKKAIQNMPKRVRTVYSYDILVADPMPAPEYIEKIAKKEAVMRDGRVWLRSEHQYCFGETCALGYIMYPQAEKSRGKKPNGHMNVRSSVFWGHAPSGAERQSLLMKLAEEGGRELALQKLKEMGRRTDWYVA